MEIFHAFDNIFGGHDYSVDGHWYHTQDNIFGGEDIYEDGTLAANTHDNIFGGEDIYDNNHRLLLSTNSNIFGDHDIYSGDHNYLGTTHDTPTGMEYIDQSGAYAFSVQDMGNITTILGYSDPLAHVGNYIMPSMIL